MRSLFLAHGSPLNALADNGYTRFLGAFGERLNADAILMISAHWESDELTLTRRDGVYEMIYDFFGFPPELSKIIYPARGSAEMTDRISACLDNAGFAHRIDERRGIDHGSWTLLMHLLPGAEAPVVHMSLNAGLPAKRQIELGRALRGLSSENVAVVGSGVTVHNLRALEWKKGFDAPADDWAVAFDDWLLEHSSLASLDGLERYLEIAPRARAAAPTLEHFVPYLIARGAGAAEDPKLLHRAYEMGNLSYLAVEF